MRSVPSDAFWLLFFEVRLSRSAAPSLRQLRLSRYFSGSESRRLCWRSGACSLLSAYATRNLSARARVTRVRIRADVSEHAARTDALSKDFKMKSVRDSDRSEQSHAGDVLLLPIAVIAFWTLAYDLVLVARWPAQTITWCFLAIAIGGFFALGRLWTKTGAIPGKAYRFHPSHIFLLALGLGYAITALFVRRPNQDDVVYFHRTLTQLPRPSPAHPLAADEC